MRDGCGLFIRPFANGSLFVAVASVAVLAGFLTIGFAPPAQALPSFARQTGQPCGTCHTDFPALTPYGRRFKLLGYTTGGGPYKTTPFSSRAGSDARAEFNKLRGYANDVAPPPAVAEKGWVPPIAMMAVVGFTHTQGPTVAPPTDPYNANDNVVLSPFSVFWGGAITDNIGAFAQVTYSAPDPLSALTGTPADQFNHTWAWDNTDVRFARTASIGPLDLVYGISANNNPTVQDLWNTTPAWTFPFATSNLAATPGASTVIEGTFAARVAGVGAYAMINDMLYMELSAYKTLGFSEQNSLGMNPFGGPGLTDVSPYWRVALEPHWGPHTFMLGTYGMITNVHPWIDSSFATGTTGTLAQSDKFTDIGVDSQYQYQGSNYWLTLRANYIREFQRLDASFFAVQASANPTNELNSLRLTGSFAYGGDNRIVLTGQYFNVWGTPDALVYAANASGISPNSDGWMAELAYIPFGTGKSPGWPWFNARIALQYIYYNKFDGTTIGAHDNNTLFLHAWFAM